MDRESVPHEVHEDRAIRRAIYLASVLVWMVTATVAAGRGGAVGNETEPSSGELERALAVAREEGRIAGERDLWPGFQALTIPLAIFTGQNTYLFRHPAPPEGFSPVAGSHPSAFSWSGRHQAMTANSSAEIGGISTATLLMDGPSGERSPSDLAAVALHEAFHVFQRREHPSWKGNEGDLFLYPFDDGPQLGLRRLESEALRRALAEEELAASRCWAGQALAFRKERFSLLDPTFVAYERGTELNEGLAAYIQLKALGRSTIDIPAQGFGPTEVRQRVYIVGPALGLLLDRFRPGWKAILETEDSRHLDLLLGEAVPEPGQKAEDELDACAFSPTEISERKRGALAEADAVVEDRRRRRVAFEAAAGWRILVEVPTGEPLWPQGFDPLNVERLERGLLHTRFLRLGNALGELEILDGEGVSVEAVTEGAGPHPLFNGIRKAVIRMSQKPSVESQGQRVILEGPGFQATFQRATVRVDGKRILVALTEEP